MKMLTKRRLSSRPCRRQQVLIVRRHNHRHHQYREHIEDEDAPKDTFRRLGNIPARVLRLCGGVCDALDAGVGVRGTRQGRPEAGEAPEGAGDVEVLHEGALGKVVSSWADCGWREGTHRIPPVPEPYPLLSFDTAQVNYEAHDDDADDLRRGLGQP